MADWIGKSMHVTPVLQRVFACTESGRACVMTRELSLLLSKIKALHETCQSDPVRLSLELLDTLVEEYFRLSAQFAPGIL